MMFDSNVNDCRHGFEEPHKIGDLLFQRYHEFDTFDQDCFNLFLIDVNYPAYQGILKCRWSIQLTIFRVDAVNLAITLLISASLFCCSTSSSVDLA